MSSPLALYIHIPFCQRKCPYCDFNTYAGLQRLYDPLAEALATEIQAAGAARIRPRVSTIFMGGGTPTVLPPHLFARILDACRLAFDVLPDAEITCEANPGTVDTERFAALRALGVNRLSMGAQSFDADELRFLGRIHSSDDVTRAVCAAQAAGFENINLDLIYGLPGQANTTWQTSLSRALALGPQHLSLYGLTIEEGTPFGDWAAAGSLAYPDPDLVADQYELAATVLQEAGYVHYEISNWARHSAGAALLPGDESPDFACRHNLTYWRNDAYLGFGPGAHSSEHGRRWATIRAVPAYIDAVSGGDSALDCEETTGEALAMSETMILGLRLVREGVPLDRFEKRHRRSLLDAYVAEIARLESLRLLDVLPDRVRLTPKARLVGNQVFQAFLP